jgi:hypothetical protein
MYRARMVKKLRQWILERRQNWNRPKGYLFKKRPVGAMVERTRWCCRRIIINSI